MSDLTYKTTQLSLVWYGKVDKNDKTMILKGAFS